MRIRTLSLCLRSAVGSALVVGAGWLWARLAVSAFQRHEGVTMLSNSPRVAHYELWGVSVPSAVAANIAFVIAALSLSALWNRRDIFSLLALSAYFVALAVGWVFLFADLDFEAFE